MNKIKKNKALKFNLLFVLLSFLIQINLNASLEQLGKLLNLDQINLEDLTQNKTFSTQLDKEIEILKKIKSEQSDLFNLRKKEIENLKIEIDKFKEKEKEKIEKQDEFSIKYLMILNQSSQTLSEINQVYQQIVNLIDTNIKILQEFKNDPEFKAKNLKIPFKSIYSIEDIQKLNDLMLQYDTKIINIEEKIKKASSDLEQLKKSLNLAKQEHEDKKKEQKEFKSEENNNLEFTITEKAQILDAEENLLLYKKNLAELKLKEIEQKKQLFSTELRIYKIQLEIIINEYEKAKNFLCVDDKDLKRYEENFKNQTHETSEEQELITKKINALEIIKDSQLKKLTELKKKYKLTDTKINLIKDWLFVPNKLDYWVALINIGKISNYINYEINIGKEDLLAQIDNQKAKEVDKRVENLIVNTWYKITTGKLNSFSQEDLISKEIKKYEKEKTDLIANISITSDKQSEIINALNTNNIIVENIKSRMNDLKEQKDTIFKNKQNEYLELLNQLKIEGFDEEPKRNESITHLIELYNNINNSKKLTIKKIDIILEELKARVKMVGIPILLKGIKNFIPDIKKFFSFLYNKKIKDAIDANKKNYLYLINYYNKYPSEFGLLIFNLIIILLAFIFIKIYYLNIINLFKNISPKYGIGLVITNFIIISFEFLVKNLSLILIWSLLLLSIKFRLIIDNYTIIMFYLISIPIWLILTYKYIRSLSDQNIENNYFLISKEYQKRFLTILYTTIYANIILLFLKEGFTASPFAKSNITITLQALQFVILQIGLIFILSKEQILNLIPKTNNFWQWLYDQTENYYYLVLSTLIFVIIMSNPYLGYGRQFFYFISRFILILFLIPIVIAIHNKIKRLLTSIFFYSESEGIKERFAHAKTAYGVFVIGTFIFFITLAAVIAAKILGYNDILFYLEKLLHESFYEYRSIKNGQIVEVNSVNLIHLALWLLGGIICSYIVNRFILNKIFDLLLVNIGIQNAIISLVKYTIIISAFIIGLLKEGMGSAIIWIVAIFGALGVAAKELISDLIGYFIILIQRPIKIGDFIKINDDVNGIVRHITLRSVTIRRKNSVTIIIPNSHIISKPVVNWNYSRSYFAFDDILLTVPYSADPEKVRDLILKVVDSNINILKNPVPIVWLHDFTENGYQFLIRGYISFDRVLEQWHIASDVRLALVRTLRINGIQIAYPVRLFKMIENNKSMT